VKLDNLKGPIREYLDLKPEEYLWKGKIDDMIKIYISKKHIVGRWSINFPIRLESPTGSIIYKDTSGKEYKKEFYYKPISGVQINWVSFSTKGFFIEVAFSYACFVSISRRYYVLLEAKDESYTKSFNISHKIPPNDVERFQVAIDSDKSATYKVIIKFYYDENGVIKTKPMSIYIKRHRDMSMLLRD
jgi:hypothetical protein